RKLSTWRSGRTSRWVSAFGLMSRIATKPSVFATWSPSRTSRQKRQSSGSDDPLLGDVRATHPDEGADRSADAPRAVVVAVAAAGPVDEDGVLAADLRPPPREARGVGIRAQARAPLLLHRRGNGVGRRGRGARAGRVREDVHLGDPSGAHRRERTPEGALVLGREADDDVGREVEVVAERRQPAEIRREAVPAGPG